MYTTTPREAFVTLKNHFDFATYPKVRLINPCKPEVGKVALKILANIVEEVNPISHGGGAIMTTDIFYRV